MDKTRSDNGTVHPGDASLQGADEYRRVSYKLERYEKHLDLCVDQVTSLSKWLSASLFAVNSGGLLTLLNQSQSITNIQTPGILFISGIIFSLLSATINQEVYNRAATHLHSMINYWQEYQITYTHYAEQHDQIAAKLTNINRYMWLGPTTGWISGLAFVIGALIVGLYL